MVYIGGKTVLWIADPHIARADCGGYLDEMAKQVLRHRDGKVDYVVLLEEAVNGPLRELLLSEQHCEGFQNALRNLGLERRVDVLHVLRSPGALAIHPSQFHFLRRLISEDFKDAILSDILPLTERKYTVRAVAAYALRKP